MSQPEQIRCHDESEPRDTYSLEKKKKKRSLITASGRSIDGVVRTKDLDPPQMYGVRRTRPGRSIPHCSWKEEDGDGGIPSGSFHVDSLPNRP